MTIRSSDAPRVAVVGATGAVGRVMLRLLHERSFPASEVIPVATERSQGRRLPFGDGELTVRAISPDVLDGVDLVLLDTPDEAARQWAPVAVDAGAIVVDNSAAWRMEERVPLVVPEVNPGALEAHEGIVASPNCTTIGVVVPLAALHRAFGLRAAAVSSYQAVSGAGQRGVEELREQAAKVHGDLEALADGEYRGPEPETFDAPIAFNVVPAIGSEQEEGFTSEEWKLTHESRKILGLPSLEMTATCVRVPAVVGHGASVRAIFDSEVDLDGALDALRGAEGVEVTDLPTPLAAAGKDTCLVGRVRRDPFEPTALWFFSASDNLRKGAATNTLQIAELLFG